MPHSKPADSQENQWNLGFFVAILLGGQIVVRLLKGKIPRPRQLLEQMVTVGLGSLNSVLLIAFFAGMIFTVQTARELTKYGAVSAVGGAFALAFCRELAPILTASVVAGQVGSAFAAEIAEMQVTEQIDALYMLKTDPIDYLVIPRVIACCVMLPVLTTFSLTVGLAGGVFVATYFYNINPSVFLNSVRDFLEFQDLLSIVLKGLIFGAFIGLISCGFGITARGGAKGVSRATTATVVTTWISIFVADFILSLAIFQELNIYPNP
ncbi:MAG TPA: MlaE family lipid ABC transporter permease subunit [Cyanophyceae cyanobacterium]